MVRRGQGGTPRPFVATNHLTQLSRFVRLYGVGKLIPAAEAAKRMDVDASRIRQLCIARRIPGARRIGRMWMLPQNFEVKPGARGPALGSKKR